MIAVLVLCFVRFHKGFPVCEPSTNFTRINECVHEWGSVHSCIRCHIRGWSLLNRIIPTKSLNGFYVFAREDALIFKPPAPEVEKQRNGRSCRFEIIDDLRQFVVGQLVAKGFEFDNDLLIGE